MVNEIVRKPLFLLFYPLEFPIVHPLMASNPQVYHLQFPDVVCLPAASVSIKIALWPLFQFSTSTFKDY